MSFADVESERERVPLELFSAQKLRKATDELSLLPKFPDFVLQLSKERSSERVDYDQFLPRNGFVGRN